VYARDDTAGERKRRRRRRRVVVGVVGCDRVGEAAMWGGGVAGLPGGSAGVPGGVYNRTICRSLSRTREVRRSANQIGIPPLVHCHKMAALNQLDSAYCAPPPGALLLARHEKLRLSIHFYRSCFSVLLSPSLSLARTRRTRTLLPEFRARSSFSTSCRCPSFSRCLNLSLSRTSTSPPLFNNRSLCSIVRHTELPCPFACLFVTNLAGLSLTSPFHLSLSLSCFTPRIYLSSILGCVKQRVNLIIVK